MTDYNTLIRITLSVNGLNTTIKRQTVRVDKNKIKFCVVYKTSKYKNSKYKGTGRLNVKIWRDTYYANPNKKRVKVAILV